MSSGKFPFAPGSFVLVDGSFDPLHSGHIKYFEEARNLFSLPIVCLIANDGYVSKKHQIFLNVEERLELISSLQQIDFAIINETTTADFIDTFRPFVYFKGKDWKGKLPIEEEVICSNRNVIIQFATTDKKSSTEILTRYLSSVNNFERKLAKFENAVLQQTEPKPTKSFDKNYFKESWRSDGHSYTLESRRIAEGKNPDLIKEVFNPVRILDAGCGPGTLLALLRERGLNAIGLDASVSSKVEAVSEMSEYIEIGSICEMPFENNSFDLVICREVFEHLHAIDIITAIQELCRVSSKYIYLTTRFTRDQNDVFGLDTEYEVDPTHITCLNLYYLRSIFTMNNFKRRIDLENKIDWLKKGRVLVYEKIPR